MTLEFDVNTKDYCLGNALFLAKAARLAYEDRDEVERVASDELGLDRIKFFDRAGTQVFVGADSEKIIVAYRGTEPQEIMDFLADAWVSKEAGPKGQIHKGFTAALDLVWDDVQQAINDFQTQGQSLWFTGHSLGAALATLSTARLRLEDGDKSVNGLYTFGSPRVGDTDFAEAFNSDFYQHSFRFINNEDIVTLVPPEEMGYSHVGTMCMFDENGTLKFRRAMWFDYLSRFVEDAIEEIREAVEKHLMGRFKDHSMDEYVRLLEQCDPDEHPEESGPVPKGWFEKLLDGIVSLCRRIFGGGG